MYEAYYGLRQKPFSLLPDPDFIYWGRKHMMAYAVLEHGLLNREGFTVISGGIGTGKTTLARHLLKKVNPNAAVGILSNAPSGRHELLQWILMSLRQPFDGDYAVLFNRLQKFLYGGFAGGRQTVLIIDEAQSLELDALEHLRMLSNINADKFQILQVILIGQPELRTMLLTPKLHQFAQRISSDFHLNPLDRADVAKYIAFRLEKAGANEPIFTPQACARVAIASNGVPRVINVICDAALFYGFSNEAKTVSEELIGKVVADKQQNSVFPISGAAEIR
jgi:type II secretory pathway predicted ATPase ExeA